MSGLDEATAKNQFMLTLPQTDDIIQIWPLHPRTSRKADILGQVISPDEPTLPEASARSILALHFNDEAIRQRNELAEKNRLGTISEADHAVLEKYQRVGSFLNLLQAKARLSLAKSSHRS